MAVLTLDVGGANLVVACQKGGHAGPRKVGDRGYLYGGGEVSAVRAELMVVPVILAPSSAAQAATIRALFALGAQVACAGDVFNNASATIVCSGMISDELDETDSWWTINLTLYEVTAAGYAPVTTDIYLANVVSSGAVNLATPNAARSPFGAGTATVTLLSSGTVPTCAGPSTNTCATLTSPASEKTWITDAALAAGWLSGPPTVSLISIGVADAARWATQDAMFKIFFVRDAADIAEWDTAWSAGNGGFAGGTITMAAPAIVYRVEIGDKLRFQLYGRVALRGGFADDASRQIVTYGNGGAQYGKVTIGGDLAAVWP